MPMFKTSSAHLQCHPKTDVYKNYLLHGWRLLPLHSIQNSLCTCHKKDCASPGKHPLTMTGLKEASNHYGDIEKWIKKWPFMNIGIATGCESGVVVLDIDKKTGGFESLEKLEKENGTLPVSIRVKTGGKGLHIYFKATHSIRNRASVLPGIDFRGEGGYVVAPPSEHISEDSYEFININNELEELPNWLYELLLNKKQEAPKEPTCSLGAILEGSRNTTLISISGFLKSKGIDSRLIENIISQVNSSACSPSLPENELQNIANSTRKFSAPEPWGNPEPIPEYTSEAKPFYIELLPSSLQAFCLDITERMQVPLEFVAVPMIVAAASIIGRKVVIKPLQNDPWIVVPNLWGFLVAEPGSMKSPAIAEAMKPLEVLAHKACKTHEKECENAQTEYRNLQVEIESLKQSLKVELSCGFSNEIKENKNKLVTMQEQAEKHTKIKEKRFKTNDPTVEKLAMLLKDNPQGLLLLRDELSGWLESMYKSGREGSKEFYLEAWNGNSSYSIDRIGRGTMHVEALCLSIFGGIQPAKLSEYINHHSTQNGDDGFLERFQLVVYPKISPSWSLIDRKVNEEAQNKATQAFESLDAIDMPQEPLKFIRFNSEAQVMANAWRCKLETRLRNENLSPIMLSHISKYRSLMPSLALIFTLLESNGKLLDVSEQNTRRAITWCDVLESHTLKVYQSTIHNPYRTAKNLASKIEQGLVSDGEKVRNIQRKNWIGLKKSEELDLALDLLKKINWLRVEKTKTKGGISETVYLNPALNKKGVSL
jgi:hypothetical protein